MVAKPSGILAKACNWAGQIFHNVQKDLGKNSAWLTQWLTIYIAGSHGTVSLSRKDREPFRVKANLYYKTIAFKVNIDLIQHIIIFVCVWYMAMIIHCEGQQSIRLNVRFLHNWENRETKFKTHCSSLG